MHLFNFSHGSKNKLTFNDPYFSYVSLLLHGDGSNGSTSIIDSSPASLPVTSVNSAAITNAVKKFGSGSLSLTNSRYCTVPVSAPLNFGTGDFTIEMFVMVNSYRTVINMYYDCFCAMGPVNAPIYLRIAPSGSLAFGCIDNETVKTWNPTPGIWY